MLRIVGIFFTLFTLCSQSLYSQVSIPVVLHLVSNESINETTDQLQFEAALVFLNDFLAGNAACGGLSNEAAINIELCLATRNVLGQATDGIIHYRSPLGVLDACQDEETLKALSQVDGEVLYPTDQYLNIYVVDEVCNSCSAGNCLAGGFSSLPGEHGLPLDGIVTERFSWKSQNCHDRKAIIHEIGHFFGLLHTFSGADCSESDCTMEGDLICDTPPDISADIFASNPCLNGEEEPNCGDAPSSIGNLMDYAPLSCLYTFTPGQAARISEQLTNFRGSFFSSLGCDSPCPSPVDIHVDLPAEPFVPFQPYLLENNTTGGTSFVWILNGVPIATTRDLELTLRQAGIHQLELRVDAPGSGCNQRKSWQIEAVCPAPELIISGPVKVEVGEMATYSITISPSINEYVWRINGETIAENTLEVQYEFQDEGTYYVEVVTSDPVSGCENVNLLTVSVGVCETGLIANRWPTGSFFQTFHLVFTQQGTEIDTSVPPSPIAWEATMAATDSSGSLLFWSNGREVLSASNLELHDGLDGHWSAINQVLVRRPNSQYVFDLFYPDFFPSPNITDNKLYHATISFDPTNQEIVIEEENKELLMPSTEGVTAIRHCNGTDWWIVGRRLFTNQFSSFRLTKDGVTDTVDTFIGDTLYSESQAELFTQVRASPDGTMIAATYGPYVGPNEDHQIRTGKIILFDFDSQNGTISGGTTVADSLRFTQGLQFSRNNKLLYYNTTVSDRQYALYQVEIDSLRNLSVFENPVGPALKLIQHNEPDTYTGGAIAEGPDGKLYIANFSESFISVIHRPNLPGVACNFNRVGIDLSTYGVASGFGLPQFPASAAMPNAPQLSGPNKYDLCTQTDALTFVPLERCFYQAYDFELLSPGGSLLRKTPDTAFVLPIAAGRDTLVIKAETACNVLTDTVFITIQNCSPSPPLRFRWEFADTVVCAEEAVELSYSTNAAEVLLLDEDGDLITGIPNRFYRFIPPPDRTRFGILLRDTVPPLRDTLIYFSTKVNDTLAFEWTSAPASVCAGEYADFAFTSEAESAVLFRQDFDRGAGQLLEATNFRLGPFQQDSCYRLRLRQNDRSCEKWLDFCVTVSPPPVATNETFTGCPGTPLILPDTTIIDTGTIVRHFQTAERCDSTHTIIYEFHPLPDTTFVVQERCSPSPPDTMVLSSFRGCDSLVIINYVAYPATSDTTRLFVSNCLPSIPPDTTRLNNRYGCDSTIITFYEQNLSANDTTVIQLADCEIETIDTSTFVNQAGCDSIVITIQSLFPMVNDTTRLVVEDCGLAGSTDTTILLNSFGCDSLVITNFETDLTGVDTNTVRPIVCSPRPNDTLRLVNIAGCDSLVIVDYQLAPNATDTIFLTLPFCQQTGISDTARYINQFGCDSTVITNYEPVFSNLDTTFITDYDCGPFPDQSDTSIYVSASGCDSVVVFNLLSTNRPSIDLLSAYMITRDDSLRFSIEQPANTFLQWEASSGELTCTDCASPVFRSDSSATISLSIIDSLGCMYFYETRVFVSVPPEELYFPSAFSPNDDGLNDVWTAFSAAGLDVNWLGVSIYDRWGNQVYTSIRGMVPAWDGGRANPDVYVFFGRAEVNGVESIFSGEIVLMR